MQIYLESYDPNKKVDCIILPVYKDGKLPELSEKFDESNNKVLTKLISEQDITGKYGEIKSVYNISDNAKQIISVGAGDPHTLTGSKYIKLINNVFNTLTNKPYNTIVSCLTEIELYDDNPCDNLNSQTPRSIDWKTRQNIICAEQFANPVNTYLSSEKPKLNIESLYIVNTNNSLNDNNELITQNLKIADAIKTAKDLGNMPPNDCNPAYFATRSKELAEKHSNLNCEIHSHDELEKLGMGAFCSVSQGSNHPGCMIILNYTGSSNKTDAPYVLIGKGITFDTGGYTLKPPKAMLGMKYDMCGAASVFATMQAVAELNLPINVIGMLACAENMIGHKSTRPNDIVKSLNGKTIEINNTDAEGRLVLCDTMTYSKKFNPKVVIDVATLTGAAMVALGFEYTAAYTNDKNLQKSLLAASHNSHDLIWPMPICEDYHELMENPMADLQNSSSMPLAGSITAACFLSHFIPENTPWAHLDIAGSATVRSEHTEATGRPVPLLVNYLLDQCK